MILCYSITITIAVTYIYWTLNNKMKMSFVKVFEDCPFQGMMIWMKFREALTGKSAIKAPKGVWQVLSWYMDRTHIRSCIDMLESNHQEARIKSNQIKTQHNITQQNTKHMWTHNLEYGISNIIPWWSARITLKVMCCDSTSLT